MGIILKRDSSKADDLLAKYFGEETIIGAGDKPEGDKKKEKEDIEDKESNNN